MAQVAAAALAVLRFEVLALPRRGQIAAAAAADQDLQTGLLVLLKEDSRSISSSGIVESYVHTGGKVAVLLSLESTEGNLDSNESLSCLAKDLCMHIAATSPICVSRDDVSEESISKEKDIALAQAEGKPPQAVEKIVSGKLEKYFSTVCLLEQPFVKDPDLTVVELIKKTSSDSGNELKVGQFIRFQVGEET